MDRKSTHLVITWFCKDFKFIPFTINLFGKQNEKPLKAIALFEYSSI